jgi:hypothetical protein
LQGFQVQFPFLGVVTVLRLAVDQILTIAGIRRQWVLDRNRYVQLEFILKVPVSRRTEVGAQMDETRKENQAAHARRATRGASKVTSTRAVRPNDIRFAIEANAAQPAPVHSAHGFPLLHDLAFDVIGWEFFLQEEEAEAEEEEEEAEEEEEENNTEQNSVSNTNTC